MKALHPSVFTISTLAIAAALLVCAALTPHDPYYRWQELETKFSRKGDWIYERLHFDPTPIDVALIGTSRTANGISGPDVEKAFCEATGRRIQVVNLGYAGIGRDIEYVIAKEAAFAKKPRLLLVELNEFEFRNQHESFIVIANPIDVLAAPIFVNSSYISNVGRLPGRQLSLFFKTRLRTPNVRETFDRAAYNPRADDRTRAYTMLDGTMRSRFVRVPADELEKELRTRRREKKKAELPRALEPIGHNVARHYLKGIEKLARAHGGAVQYLFLPAYMDPAMPESVRRQLDVEGPIIDLGGSLALKSEFWRDATHTNAWGSMAQSKRLGQELARAHPGLGVEGCAPAPPGGALR
jgi:hypothetical protein